MQELHWRQQRRLSRKREGLCAKGKGAAEKGSYKNLFWGCGAREMAENGLHL